ncbi:MAG: hypothetical protein KDA44_22780 [Planctomycetales bacterium]|nr:hypothetical protein [Planctomycetales bacterium]
MAMSRIFRIASAFVLAIGASSLAQASIVVNGTFDTDLSGWSTAVSGTGVTWQSQEARVGQPGTPGVAALFQSFFIPAGSTQLTIDFDYQWEVNAPALADLFEVELSYLDAANATQTVTILSESSAVAAFGPPATAFSTIVSLPGLNTTTPQGTILFRLTEHNSNVGTRIELDNVVVTAQVPEASTLVIWSSLACLGMLLLRRRVST